MKIGGSKPGEFIKAILSKERKSYKSTRLKGALALGVALLIGAPCIEADLMFPNVMLNMGVWAGYAGVAGILVAFSSVLVVMVAFTMAWTANATVKR